MKYLILLLLVILYCIKGDVLFVDAYTQTFASNLTHAIADDTELMRLANLCAADTRCSRFSGMSIGGSFSIDTFTQMITLVPFTQNPPTFNIGIYDVLVNGGNVGVINDRLTVLLMVYYFSYFSSSCASIEIPVLTNGVMVCEQNPRVVFLDPNYYNWFAVVSMVFTIILLLCMVIGLFYGLVLFRNAIRATQTQHF